MNYFTISKGPKEFVGDFPMLQRKPDDKWQLQCRDQPHQYTPFSSEKPIQIARSPAFNDQLKPTNPPSVHRTEEGPDALMHIAKLRGYNMQRTKRPRIAGSVGRHSAHGLTPVKPRPDQAR